MSVVPRFRLSYFIGLAPVGVQDKCLSDQLRSYVLLLRKDSSRKTTPVSKIRSESLKWTVEVQRLLQPTRELVRSGYETRVESQGTVITR